MYVYRDMFDFFDGLQTVEEYCGNISSAIKVSADKVFDSGKDNNKIDIQKICEILNSLEKAMYAARKEYWEGDIKQGPFILPIPDSYHSEMVLGFIWKQGENGSTFICSPIPLPWLEKQ
jgi:hypothetical protein